MRYKRIIACVNIFKLNYENVRYVYQKSILYVNDISALRSTLMNINFIFDLIKILCELHYISMEMIENVEMVAIIDDKMIDNHKIG